MSNKLVSKWADVDDLSQPRASKSSQKLHLGSSLDKPEPKSKSKPLESKWAKAENTAKSSDKNSNNRSPERRYNTNSNRYGGSRQRGGYGNKQLMTPPTSSSKDHKPTHSPKHQRSNSSHSDPKADSESDDDELPPMSEAAMSLAARIGSVLSSNQRDYNSKPKFSSKSPKSYRQKPQADHSRNNKPNANYKTDFVSTDEEASEDDGTDKPMSDAAKSLASRLGMVSLNNEKSNSEPKSPAHLDSKPKPKGRYLTPKQKRQLEAEQKQQAEAESLLKQKQLAMEADKERVQNEIDRIMKEMQDPNSSWADIE